MVLMKADLLAHFKFNNISGKTSFENKEHIFELFCFIDCKCVLESSGKWTGLSHSIKKSIFKSNTFIQHQKSFKKFKFSPIPKQNMFFVCLFACLFFHQKREISKKLFILSQNRNYDTLFKKIYFLILFQNINSCTIY